ncbi:uncharacterized protein LOC143021458 isoform X2 [Oratosquilla oratoria]|uniref:uncharacterized protein LOC143021458 isoform X2 n=1 Tax=Oratosquilla oratoria TaxID=337810 RepID=UPI003F76AC74
MCCEVYLLEKKNIFGRRRIVQAAAPHSNLPTEDSTIILEDIDMAEESQKKKRKPNWSQEETLLLVNVIMEKKHPCSSCGLHYCSGCLKRNQNGTRQCQKCVILAQWPLDISRITSLRVKDLRHFLHTKRVNTQTCTEKKDLIDLVVNYITSQHKADGSRRGANTSHSSPHAQPSRFQSDVSRQDDIRIRSYSASAASNSNSCNSGSSIRVRPGPLDSIRVRPAAPVFEGRVEQNDLGIRVFGSNRTEEDGIRVRAGSTSPLSEEATGLANKDLYSQCQSEDCTSSSCSLEYCNVQADASISKENSNLEEEEEDPTLFFRTDTPDQSIGRDSADNLSSPNQEDGSVDTQEDKIERDSSQVVQGEDTSLEQESSSAQSDVMGNEVAGAVVDDVQNEQSSSHVADEGITREDEEDSSESSSASAAEAKQMARPGHITLGDIKTEEDLLGLTVRQCKELLALHRVNYSGVREKQELVGRVRMLWQDDHKNVETLPEELVCKICMDSAIDCVFLECGHMVACTPCGKQMAECPVCRQYVVRIVRTFRA